MINNNFQNILIKFGLWLATGFLIMLVGISNVFGLDYIDIGDKADITVVLVSTDYASSPFNVPKNSAYNFTQVLEIDYQISNYNFEVNKNYQLESHLTQQQLTNANYYSVQGLNGEQCLISYENSIFTGAYPRWAFQCPHATNNITLTIKNSNNQYLWSTGQTNIFTWTTALLKYSNTSLSTDNQNTDAIINNQNQNTQNIINNQNQNTDAIINNQNQNTDKEIESQQVCNTKIITNKDIIQHNKYLNSGGVVSSSGAGDWGITDYFEILDNIKVRVSRSGGASTCFYTDNKTFISCITSNDLPIVGNSLDIPNNAKFVRFSINELDDAPQFEMKQCINGNQALNDSINDLDSTLKDDTVDDNGIADAFDDFNDYLDDNSTITQLITLPITLYTAILNNVNGTCQPFNLGKLYGEDLILPCINISQYLGNTLWNMIDIIISGFAVYSIAKKMIKVFNNFSSLREGDVIDD